MALAPQISVPLLPPEKPVGKKSADHLEKKAKSKKTNIVDFPALQRASKHKSDKKPSLPSRGQGGNKADEEWLKSILPPNRNDGWWETPADAKGFKIKLRWREEEGEKIIKRVYPFARLGMYEVNTLKEKNIEEQKRLIASRIFGELYNKARRDIAARLSVEPSNHRIAIGEN